MNGKNKVSAKCHFSETRAAASPTTKLSGQDTARESSGKTNNTIATAARAKKGISIKSSLAIIAHLL